MEIAPVHTEILSSEGFQARYFHASEWSEAYIEVIRSGAGMPLDEYKAAFEKLVDHAEAHGCQRMFLEQSGLENIDPKARAWLVSDCVPRMRRRLVGTLYLGVVMPRKRLANAAMKSILFFYSKLLGNFKMKSFEQVEEARRWVATAGLD